MVAGNILETNTERNESDILAKSEGKGIGGTSSKYGMRGDEKMKIPQEAELGKQVPNLQSRLATALVSLLARERLPSRDSDFCLRLERNRRSSKVCLLAGRKADHTWSNPSNCLLLYPTILRY